MVPSLHLYYLVNAQVKCNRNTSDRKWKLTSALWVLCLLKECWLYFECWTLKATLFSSCPITIIDLQYGAIWKISLQVNTSSEPSTAGLFLLIIDCRVYRETSNQPDIKKECLVKFPVENLTLLIIYIVYMCKYHGEILFLLFSSFFFFGNETPEWE